MFACLFALKFSNLIFASSLVFIRRVLITFWGYHPGFHIDFLSLFLIILTILLFIYVLVAKICFFYSNLFYLYLFLFLKLFIVISFLSESMLFFFISFEVCLIPISLMVLCYGSNPERLLRIKFFFFYSLLGSIPLLFKIIFMKTCDYVIKWSDFLFFLGISDLGSFSNWLFEFLGFLFILGFLIKLPSPIFHYWLPKVHVEAPVAGSMVLAGVLLKLGSYGLIRISCFIVLNAFCLSLLFICLLIFFVLVLCLRCLGNNDIKRFIAYSSIIHMRLIIFCYLNIKYFGLQGILLISIGHGFVSSCLFLIGSRVYLRKSSRNILLRGFVFLYYPFLCLFLIICLSFKRRFPMTLPFISEIFLFSSFISFSYLFIPFIVLYIFCVGLYKIYLYVLIGHGNNQVNFLKGSVYLLDLFSSLLHFLFPIFCIFLLFCYHILIKI